MTKRPMATPEPDGSPWTKRAAWYLLLGCVALVPLVTSITPWSSAQWSYTSDAYHVPKLLTLAVLLSLATLAWAFDAIVHRRQVRWHPLLFAVSAFCLLVVLSTVFAIEPLSSLFGASKLCTGATTWLMCMWLVFMLVQHVRSGSELRAVAWAVVGSASAVASIALMQAAGADPLRTPYGPAYEWMVLQGLSTIGNPDYTGVFLIAPAINALSLVLSARSNAERYGALACTFLIALAAFTTMTRAAWVAVAIGAALFLFLATEGRQERTRALTAYVAAAAAIAIVGAMLAEPGIIASRFTRLASGLDHFLSGRITMWGDAIQVIVRYPLLGTGADRLALGAYHVQKALAYTESGQRLVLQDPHSLPLLAAGVFGIPAMLALGVSTAGPVFLGLRNLNSRREASPSRTLYAGWVAAAIALLLASLVSVWTITALVMQAVVTAACLAPLARPHKTATSVRALLIAIAATLLGVSMWGATRSFAASHHVAMAAVDSPQAHFDEARRLVPWDAKTHVDYLWSKVLGNRSVLTGADTVAAMRCLDSLDAEIRLAIERFPEELLLYRLRVDLHRVMRGAPAYRPEREEQALADALRAFPNDPEFTEWSAHAPVQ